jgi:hypothetical protein
MPTYFGRAVALAIIMTAHAVTARGQSLQQQEICAKQAKAYFQEYNAEDQKASTADYKSIGGDYVSHYNTKLNKCFVLVSSNGERPGGQTSVSTQLVDAFERRTYADYWWRSQKDKKYWEVPPTTCELTPKGKPALNEDQRETTNCSSKGEFDAFVAKYMEEQ